MAEIAANAVYGWDGPNGSRLVRVLWPARKLGRVSLIDLPGKLPRFVPLAEFEARAAEGRIALLEDHPFHPPPLGDGRRRPPGKSRREPTPVDPEADKGTPLLTGDMTVALKRYEAISPLVNDPGRRLLFKEHRGTLIAARAREINVSEPFLRDSCALYWNFGQELSALGGAYRLCGGPGRPKNWTRTPGPRPGPNEEGKVVSAPPLSDAFRSAFDVGVDLAKEHPDWTLDEIHGKLLIDRFPEETVPKDEIPLVTQLGYHLRKHYPVADRLRRKVGSRKYLKDHAAHFGTSYNMAFGPGSYWEIDGMWGEHELVSEFNRTRKVGRATIYLVIDVFSRAIMGVYVSLRPFNTNGARIALANAMTGKAALCDYLGMDEASAAAWRSGVCHNLGSDRGKDLLTPLIEGCASFHRIGLDTMTAARGDLKPNVENANSQVKKLLKELTGKVKERDSDRPATKPAFTLKEYFRAVAEACVLLNTTRRVENCPPEAYAKDGTAPTRLELFDWGLDNRCAPRHANDETIRLSLLPRHWVRETAEGLALGKLRFKPIGPGCDLDFAERPGKVWARRQVALDERLLDNAMLLDRHGKPCCPCRLSGSGGSRFSGMSLDEYRAHEQVAASARRANGNGDARRRAEGKSRLAALNAEALAKSGKAVAGGDREGIAATRKAEVAASPEEQWVDPAMPRVPGQEPSARPRGGTGAEEDDDDELDLTAMIAGVLGRARAA